MPGSAHPPLQPGWIDRPHRRLALGDLPLESGEVLRNAHVSYVVHGDDSLLADHPVLATTAIGSTHHRLDFLIGSGNALDPQRHCIIVADALGNGLSSSPSNSASQGASDFPRLSIRDMVESQRLLLDHLGVGRLTAVIGASMGGMQALQWAVSHPRRMRSVVAITPMAKTTRWSQLLNEMTRRAFFADAACTEPRPRADAMRLWVPLTQLLMPRTPAALATFDSQSQLSSWMDEAALRFETEGPDAFDWCCQTHAYDNHDIGATPGFDGSSTRALSSVAAATLVLAPTLDLYNPAEDARAIAIGISGARFVQLPGDGGHASASGTDAVATPVLRERLAVPPCLMAIGA